MECSSSSSSVGIFQCSLSPVSLRRPRDIPPATEVKVSITSNVEDVRPDSDLEKIAGKLRKELRRLRGRPKIPPTALRRDILRRPAVDDSSPDSGGSLCVAIELGAQEARGGRRRRTICSFSPLKSVAVPSSERSEVVVHREQDVRRSHPQRNPQMPRLQEERLPSRARKD